MLGRACRQHVMPLDAPPQGFDLPGLPPLLRLVTRRQPPQGLRHLLPLRGHRPPSLVRRFGTTTNSSPLVSWSTETFLAVPLRSNYDCGMEPMMTPLAKRTSGMPSARAVIPTSACRSPSCAPHRPVGTATAADSTSTQKAGTRSWIQRLVIRGRKRKHALGSVQLVPRRGQARTLMAASSVTA